MKNYKNLVPILLVALMIVSIFSIISDASKQNSTIQSYVEQAAVCREQKLYDRAAGYINNAIELDNDIEYYINIADMYYEGNMIIEAIDAAKRIVKEFPEDSVGYERLLLFYIECKDYKKAYKILDDFNGRKLKSNIVDEYIKEIEYSNFSSYNSFDDLKQLSNGYMAVKKKELWGLADSMGSNKVTAKFEDVGFYANGVIPVKFKNEWFLMNESGELLYNISINIEGSIDGVGIYNEQLLPICVDGSYGYYDLEFKNKLQEYDYAGCFNNGVAAVKNDDGWFIIDTSGDFVSDKYEDIFLDSRGICCINERIFVKENGYYYMVDTKGNNIGSLKFDEVDYFNTDGLAAVNIDGLWGFIDKSGSLVIEASYEKAKSFSMGLAAICNNGFWGFIDKDGNEIIECKYDDCTNFNSKGVAFANKSGRWSSINLYKYNH